MNPSPRCALGNVNGPAARTQTCHRCGHRRPVHSYHGSDPTKPTCEGCTTILQLLTKFLFMNSHPACRTGQGGRRRPQEGA